MEHTQYKLLTVVLRVHLRIWFCWTFGVFIYKFLISKKGLLNNFSGYGKDKVISDGKAVYHYQITQLIWIDYLGYEVIRLVILHLGDV